ncbi:type I-E CRISPR-associated protein Cas6/Cse3/CasE [Achromobacter sp. GG226]|uniref:type I-E CRISPR-associated protein Cas6/Cse3/CasE n=1 Tax=Verticiella alkaliphila TaxID=2779529 RepID=UPI001C0D70A7|nr:type I-E CRISPR-associated protein Cas6/Cse3/CasE [Verticiella sp. GG226]MBU4612120.1 type I-E CRISPR-associated protein Cas6/Cse3/CasE [Verticiella sp. GG226]
MSHYFSRARIIARPRDSELLQTLARHGAAYRDHALVWQLFPGDGEPRDFVFRAQTQDDGGLVYYVVSRRLPQADPGLFSVQTKPYSPALDEGEVVRFDLRANPTVSRRVEGGPSRRHDVLMDAKRAVAGGGDARSAEVNAAAMRWLVDRSAAWGLNVDAGTVQQSAYQQHRLRRKGEDITYSSLDYQGLARVADSKALQDALCHGVGHAKGFGCGLLLVKRLG